MNDMSGRRWNQLIDAANHDLAPEEIVPPLANDERESYETMRKEIGWYRQHDPKFCYSPVEIDYDEIPDIRNKPVGARKPLFPNAL